MNKFIFDVDGTLTPSRQKISGDFQRWFLEFCYDNEVYLVTGSDYSKTVEQIGVSICESVRRVYNCSGSDVWEAGVNTQTLNWALPETAHGWLSEELAASKFELRTGQHFEDRPGMCNFSIVGRGATLEQRKKYVRWDQETGEREKIAVKFNHTFPELEARVGGETGIDIYPRGNDKSQILRDFDDDDFIVFFGDRMDEGGNDYPLALANYNGTNYHVKNWKHTWEILRENFNNWT
jgi:phosphomannomutase